MAPPRTSLASPRVPHPPARAWRALLRLAIAEDLGRGDLSSALVVPESARGGAVLETRQPLRVCGLEVARAVFHELEPGLALSCERRDGDELQAGEVLARIEGSLRAILAAERTALNFLGRMSGVATLTRRFVEAVAGTGARIVDTRKTLPGWRALDKYATAVGGAVNHRTGLYDGVLLKDNHVAAAGGVAAAVKSALAEAPDHLRVQVEVESLEQARAAVAAGADFLLLDNRPPAELREIAEALGPGVLLEASGGITLENVRETAESGVRRISVGALTHSAPAADVSLGVLAGGVAE